MGVLETSYNMQHYAHRTPESYFYAAWRQGLRPCMQPCLPPSRPLPGDRQRHLRWCQTFSVLQNVLFRTLKRAVLAAATGRFASQNGRHSRDAPLPPACPEPFTLLYICKRNGQRNVSEPGKSCHEAPTPGRIFRERAAMHKKRQPAKGCLLEKGFGLRHFTSMTRYLLVLQNDCGLVMRSTYCLLASRCRV